eukprot:CAMPEP_0174329498 /NCGR_PEP_ID=MMETSP0810-20121108/15895_1 /TAXON_ID=73025 ORGANISM="Eutreptiella gymnastica-like, Strain CCMP1594" /NCGR_SAMPLE_ID=MMETSP0810 /ASSEMBLY_ACC=CAM_ASM_000659 /LENGTH=121 /DNA_ID=CAMNT_0015444041 /DNA_START=23 /DNA_END=388 /DNA_ORIENTATION=+
MNKPAPDWNLDIDGEEKLTMTQDTKVENAVSFRINKEDHTLGNFLRSKIEENEEVLFVGYKIPHPLTHAIELKVHCTNQSTPVKALHEALDGLLDDIAKIERQFKSQLEQSRQMDDGARFA